MIRVCSLIFPSPHFVKINSPNQLKRSDNWLNKALSSSSPMWARIRDCACSHNGSERSRRALPSFVSVIKRLLRSSPSMIETNPCRSNGLRSLVNVVRSINKILERIVMVTDPAWSSVISDVNCEARRPTGLKYSSYKLVMNRHSEIRACTYYSVIGRPGDLFRCKLIFHNYEYIHVFCKCQDS